MTSTNLSHYPQRLTLKYHYFFAHLLWKNLLWNFHSRNMHEAIWTMVFSFNHTTNQMFRITLQNYQHKTIQHDSVKFCFESCFLNCAKCTTKNLQSNRTLYGNSCKIFFFISIYTLLFLKFLAIESHFFFSKVNLIHGCPTPPNFERLMASNSMLRLPLYI